MDDDEPADADLAAYWDPQTQCEHDWPAELDGDAECTQCGLPYSEWTVD